MRSLVLAERKRFVQVCAGPVLGKGLVNTIGRKELLLFAVRNNQTIFFKLTGARGHCEESLRSQELAERKMFVQVYVDLSWAKGW